jgi:hypothetical protein
MPAAATRTAVGRSCCGERFCRMAVTNHQQHQQWRTHID